jgi:hypothetical protein
MLQGPESRGEQSSWRVETDRQTADAPAELERRRVEPLEGGRKLGQLLAASAALQVSDEALERGSTAFIRPLKLAKDIA